MPKGATEVVADEIAASLSTGRKIAEVSALPVMSSNKTLQTASAKFE